MKIYHVLIFFIAINSMHTFSPTLKIQPIISSKKKLKNNPNILSKDSLSTTKILPTKHSILDIKKRLSENDICGLMRDNTLEKLTLTNLKNILLELPDAAIYKNEDDEVFLNLTHGLTAESSKESHDYFDYNAKPLQFYLALLLGGLLTNTDQHFLDLKKSIDIFESLKQEEPDNGSIPFFLAEVKNRAGRNEQEIKSELVDALKSTRFDIFLQPVLQRLLARGMINPSYRAVFNYVMANFKIPSFTPSFKLLKNYIHQYRELSSYQYSFGFNLMKEGMENGHLQEFVFWNALQYHVGYKIFANYLKKFAPNKPMSIPNYKEIIETNPKYISSKTFWNKVFDKNSPCPMMEILYEHNNFRSDISQYLRKKSEEKYD